MRNISLLFIAVLLFSLCSCKALKKSCGCNNFGQIDSKETKSHIAKAEKPIG